MTYQGSILQVVIADETGDVFCHGQVVMLIVMRGLPVVSQVLPSLISCLLDGSQYRYTNAYTYLPKSRANALESLSPYSNQRSSYENLSLAYGSIVFFGAKQSMQEKNRCLLRCCSWL